MEEKINGRDGVRMIIMKQSGANTVQICNDVRRRLLKYKNIAIRCSYRYYIHSSENIQNSIDSLQ